MPKPRAKVETESRAATIKALIEDRFGVLMLEEKHPLLAAFPLRERRRILREARASIWPARAVGREN
jgi:hypothetical protein